MTLASEKIAQVATTSLDFFSIANWRDGLMELSIVIEMGNICL